MKNTVEFEESLYFVLEIENFADNYDQIRKSFRRLAKKYHPDSGGVTANREKFQQVQLAYEILCSRDEKLRYDRFLQEKIKKEEFTRRNEKCSEHPMGYYKKARAIFAWAKEYPSFNLDFTLSCLQCMSRKSPLSVGQKRGLNNIVEKFGIDFEYLNDEKVLSEIIDLKHFEYIFPMP